MTNVLIPELKNAPTFRKLAMVDELLASIGDLDITQDFKNELMRRSQEIEGNAKSGRSWSKVKAGKRKR